MSNTCPLHGVGPFCKVLQALSIFSEQTNHSQCQTLWGEYLTVLRVELRTLHIWGESSTTELYSQTMRRLFLFFWGGALGYFPTLITEIIHFPRRKEQKLPYVFSLVPLSSCLHYNNLILQSLLIPGFRHFHWRDGENYKSQRRAESLGTTHTYLSSVSSEQHPRQQVRGRWLTMSRAFSNSSRTEFATCT